MWWFQNTWPMGSGTLRRCALVRGSSSPGVSFEVLFSSSSSCGKEPSSWMPVEDCPLLAAFRSGCRTLSSFSKWVSGSCASWFGGSSVELLCQVSVLCFLFYLRYFCRVCCYLLEDCSFLRDRTVKNTYSWISMGRRWIW